MKTCLHLCGRYNGDSVLCQVQAETKKPGRPNNLKVRNESVLGEVRVKAEKTLNELNITILHDLM
jgi:hypothetical protein